MKTIFEKDIYVPKQFSTKQIQIARFQLLHDDEYQLSIIRVNFAYINGFKTKDKISFVAGVDYSDNSSKVEIIKTFDLPCFLFENQQYSKSQVFENENINDMIILAVAEYNQLCQLLEDERFFHNATEDEISDFYS